MTLDLREDTSVGSGHLLTVDSISVEYRTGGDRIRALRDVSLHLDKGETLGLVGESGSGKSTLALAILQHLGGNGELVEGTISFRGENLNDLDRTELRLIRGGEIGYISQNPDNALNPAITVGEQIAETIRTHQDFSESEVQSEVHQKLDQVNIPDPEYHADQYPNALSGGMKQRILIARALACNPSLLILDEPTTGLDVTTERKILSLVNSLKSELNMSLLIITHDLSVIAEQCDRVAVLYAGEIMEQGTTTKLFKGPSNPYTQGLLKAIPDISNEKFVQPIEGTLPDLDDIPHGCIYADRCEFVEEECRNNNIELEAIPNGDGQASRCRRWETVRNNWEAVPSGESITTSERGEVIMEVNGVKKYFDENSYLDELLGGSPPVKAVDGVSFDIHRGETLAIVGESGCGKSTLANNLVGLLELSDGEITFDNTPVSSLTGATLDEFRSECQIVFQHPDSSLNPHKTIDTILGRQLKVLTDLNPDARQRQIDKLLEDVGLRAGMSQRYPHELSGGEQQRVAIARAFASNPSLIVLDEPVSALDVSVQAKILNILENLQDQYSTSYVLISHDLSVVNTIADRVGVMYLGRLAELGDRMEVFNPPHHPYTRTLLSNIPRPDPEADPDAIHLEGSVPSARKPPSGCRFHTRCPQKIGEKCESEVPTLKAVTDSSHCISCHLSEEDMSKDEL